jgi:hypothetical protein
MNFGFMIAAVLVAPFLAVFAQKQIERWRGIPGSGTGVRYEIVGLMSDLAYMLTSACSEFVTFDHEMERMIGEYISRKSSWD